MTTPAQMSRNPITFDVARWVGSQVGVARSAGSWTPQHGLVHAIGVFSAACPLAATDLVPQLQRITATFQPSVVQVVGVHVTRPLERAMMAETLDDWVERAACSFPIAVDAEAGPCGPSKSLAGLGGGSAPLLILIDRAGRRRQISTPPTPDMALGAALMDLLKEPLPPLVETKVAA
jgi:hypothetical protein